MKNRKKEKIVAFILLLFIIIFLFSYLLGKENFFLESNIDTKYTMYIGLNDKNTYKQEISKKQAKKIISDICLKYTNGYTIFYGIGVYQDTTDKITKEKSIVCIFYSISREKIDNIMEEIIVKLNQDSILLETIKVKSEYYKKEESIL